jgi:hypothetical protein
VKKLLLILLLALLPLQYSWAAVAAYCLHEKELSSPLVLVDEQEVQSKTLEEKVKTAKMGCGCDGCVDCANCTYCHPSFLATIPGVTPDIAVPVRSTHAEAIAISFSSHVADGPRRPDRLLVA